MNKGLHKYNRAKENSRTEILEGIREFKERYNEDIEPETFDDDYYEENLIEILFGSQK